MIDYLRAVKCPELEDVLKKFDIVEKRAKISLNNYLGKQPLTSPLQTETDSFSKYYGEVNEKGSAHGRGIDIWNHGLIRIGYFENGLSTGNHIRIYWNGDFKVGEVYLKDGLRWIRGTEYNKNGTECPYDNKY